MGVLADLTSACGENPGNACEWVFEQTGNEWLAEAAGWLVDKPLQILGVVVFTFVLAWALRRLVRRSMRKFVVLSGRNPLSQEAPEQLEQRAHTLATVSSSTVVALVYAAGGLWVLAILGVDVRALAIGSAFVGAALGFGAQQIVKDVLAGFLMLVENQFGVGDTIEIGDVDGVVERVSIRVTDVRDGQGTLWHIANGDIRVLGNKSSEYSTAVLDVQVSVEVAATRAIDVVSGLAEEAAKDPALAPLLLGPPKVVGVQALAPDHMTIRVTARTKPGKQWEVQRLMRIPLKDGLDAEGLYAGTSAAAANSSTPPLV
jgi:moderate conductance mechanosensitive channel